MTAIDPNTSGDLVRSARFPIHLGRIPEFPARILICFTRLAIATLSLSNVLIGRKKLRAKSASKRRTRHKKLELQSKTETATSETVTI